MSSFSSATKQDILSCGSKKNPARIPLLVKYLHNCTPKKEKPQKRKWNSAQKRCFQRIKSGCVVHRNKPLRFMTLTSAPNMKRSMSSSFRVLKERVRRKTPYSLYKEGYISKNRRAFYYPDRRYNKTLNFEYQKISTSEGVDGVYHIVYFGDYIPQEWLSSCWEDITSTAKIVDIRKVKNRCGEQKKVSYYVVNQYVTTQDNGGTTQYIRFSCSWGWCFRGFIGKWKEFKVGYRNILDYDLVYSLWDKYVWSVTHPPPDQTELSVNVTYEVDPIPNDCELAVSFVEFRRLHPLEG